MRNVLLLSDIPGRTATAAISYLQTIGRDVPNLFLINGPSGVGKSTLLELVSSCYPTAVASVLKKFRTPRKPRAEEFADCVELSVADFALAAADPEFYSYTIGETRYGFHRDHIIDAFRRTQNLFIVVRDERVINRLVADIKCARVITIFLDANPGVVRARLLAAGDSIEEIRARQQRDRLMTDPFLYACDITNNGSREEFARTIHELITDADQLVVEEGEKV